LTGGRSHRFLWLLVFMLAAGGFWLWRATRDPWPAQQGVTVPPGEDLDVARIVADTVALIDRDHVEGRGYLRSSFAKAHACVRATVEVPALEPRLRQGLFSRPARYPAWIRFSNGSPRVRSDQRRDTHGLALKVMGVPGRKLTPDESGDTQDFLLSDSPRFPVASVRDYAELAEALARDRRLSFCSHGSLLPWRWRVRECWLAFRARRAPPASLLQARYFSGTAYRFGPAQFAKFGARPCHPERPPRNDRTMDMLRARLKRELSGGAGCLELTVQLQVPGRNMPVEDPTVLWSEQDSPFLPVARVTIPRQAFDSQDQDRFCENLSFNPWHALPEHEPVGGLNRLRKAVYLEVSRYRHARNEAPLGEPHGDCLDLTGASCPAPAPSKTPTPSPRPKLKPPPAPKPMPLAEPEPAPPAEPEESSPQTSTPGPAASEAPQVDSTPEAPVPGLETFTPSPKQGNRG
jgi:hypothetical protein